MTRKKIFISYDYDNDKNYKSLLIEWDANSEFEFGITDKSADDSIDSTNMAVIKKNIFSQIYSADYFLCIIGTKTNKSDWVKWEIDKAVELGKKIIAVKIDSTNTSPDEILKVGASWAMSFTFDSIKKAIN